MSLALAAASVLVIGSQSVLAADGYPSKPVRLIVPFPPGGSTDLVARAVVQKFSEKLGQTVYVENKGGASGMIGSAEAARADPDGHTLLIVFDSHATNHHLYKGIRYDTFKDFDYVTLMTTSPMLLATPKSFASNSIAEMIAYGKQNPGKITYGSSGTGTSNHLNALSFADAAGIETLHVPYKGGGPMTVAIVAGEIDYVVATVGGVLPHVQSGALKPLGIGSKGRIPQLPDTPAIDEVLPGYGAESWIGLAAPAGLPKSVLEKVHGAMKETLADPAVMESLTSRGFNVVGSSPADFYAKVKTESDRLGALIRDRGIKVE